MAPGSSRRSASTTGGTASPKMPKAPIKPASYTFGDLANDISPIAIWLSGDPDKKLDGRTDFVSEGQVAFLCKPLSMRHTLSYRRTVGEQVDATINRVHWFFMKTGEMMKIQAQLSEKVKEGKEESEAGESDPLLNFFTFDPDDPNSILTPYGKMVSIEDDMTRVVAFVLACGGRITGYKETTNEYETDETYTPEDVADLIPARAIAQAVHQGESGEPMLLWYSIIETANLWTMQRAATALENAGETPVDTKKGN